MVEWKNEGALRGDGLLTNSKTKESLPVHYDIEIWQEYLQPGWIKRRTDAKGKVIPAPEWARCSIVVLQLEDGHRFKFWLDIGDITGSMEAIP